MGPREPCGTLLLKSADTQITFVKTDLVSSAPLAGVLAAGTYTVIASAVNGFQDSAGGLLDGNDSGTPGVNYVATFVVASTSSPVLSIPDFAGPDSAANVELPNATGTGIPITLANAIGVTSATFQLDYNPALLDITGALNGPSGTFTLVGTPSGGVANLSFQSLAHGPERVLDVGPDRGSGAQQHAAVYKSKALLHLSNISLNGGNSTVANDDGIQVDAYLGDVLGDGTYSPLDASLIARVATDFDSGFAAFPFVDPAIVGNISADGFVNSTDAA